MGRTRSPRYPALPLKEAIDFVGKIHKANRTNVIDRETAAKNMGYAGITGRSLTVLASLNQYGLLDRAGKGGVKVTQTAVNILHAIEPEERVQTLSEAANNPDLFRAIRERFPDGIPSENAIRSFLIQKDFGNAALGPALKSFIETYHYLENAGVSERYGDEAEDEPESTVSDAGAQGQTVKTPPERKSPPAANTGGYQVMEGERVVFSEEVGAAHHLKLVASGEMNVDLLDALEDFIKRQKKRIEARDKFDKSVVSQFENSHTLTPAMPKIPTRKDGTQDV